MVGTPTTLGFPTREEVMGLLTELDQAGLPGEKHAALRRLVEKYIEATTLIGKPGVTMAEIRARLLRKK